ncbi:MAG: long-chain fatty acid--CoA ligase, partial [Bifidobacterium criceti]|nr:long-chain fatty acid--CoA ligase [Bifidobacterium criceti]
ADLPEVAAEIQRYVDRANAEVSRAESVRKFIVLPVAFSQENKCLTPSMKVVRPKVNEVFAKEIANGIYGAKR